MSDLDLLVAELRKNLEVLERIRVFLDTTEAKELAVSGKTAATGLMVAGILENYYTCLETLFLRVSQSFENHMEESRWHAELLDRMTLRVPGLREPVIGEETRRDLSELLRFRHFKRYYFEFEYDWERLDFLLGKLKAVHPRAIADIEAFIAFLERAGASTNPKAYFPPG